MRQNAATAACGGLGSVQVNDETLDQDAGGRAGLPVLCGRHADLAIFTHSRHAFFADPAADPGRYASRVRSTVPLRCPRTPS